MDDLVNHLDNQEQEDLSSYCATLLNGFINESNPKTPYVGIIIWYLKDLLSKLTAMQEDINDSSN